MTRMALQIVPFFRFVNFRHNFARLSYFRYGSIGEAASLIREAQFPAKGKSLMNLSLPEIIALLEKAGIDNKAKAFLKEKGEEAAAAVVKHVFAEHDPIELSGDPDETQKMWAQTCFENFKHFLRVGGSDYGMPEFSGIQTGADFVYLDGSARTAIHNLCNKAVADELARLKAEA